MSLAHLAADTAGCDQPEIFSLVLHCCGLDRKQDSCLVRLWVVKQNCPTGKENKKQHQKTYSCPAQYRYARLVRAHVFPILLREICHA